jgi:hypothetical protein
LLLGTALLKVQGPADGAVGQNLVLFSPPVRFAVLEAEAVLGLWLLSGWAEQAARRVAVAFFLVLAAASFYLGWSGQSSCGCFGRIPVSPWGAFALDVACAMALALRWPPVSGGPFAARPRWRREALLSAGGVGAVLAAGLGSFLLAGSASPDFLARWRGEEISVGPRVSDLGADVSGRLHRFTVRLHNHSDHGVRIIGGTRHCACNATEDLPVSIPPGASVPVSVVAVFRGTPGMFQQEFQFHYTDERQSRTVMARYQGRVIQGPDRSSGETP